MWWLAIPVAVGVVSLICSVFDDETRQARTRWENQHRAVERTLEQQCASLEYHLSASRYTADFCTLADAHYASMQAADVAHALLLDARKVLDAMGQILVEAKVRREMFKTELRNTREGARRREILSEIENLNDLRAKIFPDKDKVKAEKDALVAKVRALNSHTHDLKFAIRDRCGPRGLDWYLERERRAQFNRLRRGR